MYGTTPEESGVSTGLPSDPETVEGSVPDSFSSKESPFWKIGASVSQGGQSSLGPLLQGERFLNEQREAIRKIDPEFADTLKNVNYGALPDIQDGLNTGQPKVGTWAASFKYAGFGEDVLNLALEDQKKIEEWRTKNAQNPAISGVPNIAQGIDQVKRQTQIIDEEAAETQEKLPGVNVPLLGKVTGPGLGASIAGSFSVTNPVQLGANLFFGLGGSIPKTLITSTTGRVAANAVTNGVIGSAGQAVLANPLDKSYGLPTMSAKEQAFGFMANTILGGAFSALHELGGRYMPSTTHDGMQDVKAGMDGAAAKEGPVGDAARDMMAAKTPDEASAVATGMPLEQKLDLLHEVNPNPSTEERGVINAGEKDLLLEKTLERGGMSYTEGVSQAAKAEQAIENGAPHPATEPQPLPVLPKELAGAKPRYGYGQKQFGINFASDIDKALYITAQKTPSKADAAYRSFLADQGYSAADIASEGAALKDRIKAQAKGSEAGQLDVAPGTPLQRNTPLDKVIGNIKSGIETPVARSPKAGAKYPIQKMIKDKGGVQIGSVLDQEMRSMGVNPKNAPGLFKKEGGLGDVDNFPAGEWEYGTPPQDGNGYVDRQYILDQINEERSGNPINKSAEGLEHFTAEDILRDELDRRGIDHETMSHDEIRDTLEHERMLEKEMAAPEHTPSELEPAAIEEQFQAMEEHLFPTEKTAAGEQSVIPGAEKITDKQLAERQMEKPLRSDKTQKAADDGLFDLGARAQEDMFKDMKPTDAAPVNEEKSMTVKDAMDDIHEHEGLLQAMTSCFLKG